MQLAVTGATGNAGTALLATLADDPDVEQVVGIARRRPEVVLPKVEWRAADVARDDLAAHFAGMDAVVHLAWLIQPSRDLDALRRVNVVGSDRVFAAVAAAEVPVLAYASSVGAYSEGPKDRAVDESWPINGIATSFYSRHKAKVERSLDRFESDHPEIRVSRLRPGLIFRRQAATGIRRLFLGPFFPGWLLRVGVPAIPDLERLRFQAVHSADVAEAFRLAVKSEARGAFNLAAEPVLDPPRLAELLEARRLRVPAAALRAGATVTWRMRLQPTPPGWLDMGLGVPILDSSRAREELGWEPRYSSLEALSELLDGLRRGEGYPTPPLDPATSGVLRHRELRTGIGGRGS